MANFNFKMRFGSTRVFYALMTLLFAIVLGGIVLWALTISKGSNDVERRIAESQARYAFYMARLNAKDEPIPLHPTSCYSSLMEGLNCVIDWENQLPCETEIKKLCNTLPEPSE